MTLRIAADAPLPGIEHIVVLMLENRSFDNVLGRLYEPSDGFWGTAPDKYSNTFMHEGKEHRVYANNKVASGNSPFITPKKVPDEFFGGMTHQIFGYPEGATPDMSGFAQNYHDFHGFTTIDDVGDVMFHFEPGQMHISNFLARSYAVCDQWFASGPVQTFPNRMFCHCGTPGLKDGGKAMLDDTDYGFREKTYDGAISDKCIFELLDGRQRWNPAAWKVYFHDTMFSIINDYVNQAWQYESPCLSSFDRTSYTLPYGSTFLDDLRNDALPAYAFIEPRYFDDYDKSGNPPNCNHPGGGSHVIPAHGTPIDVKNGEALVLEIFLNLIAYPKIFAKTLFIITYDEHGGIYDHVAPNTERFAAAAPSPFSKKPPNFDYSRFGVRVPAIFCHPSIAPGTIYRPAKPTSGAYHPFDHTSIIATLRAQFALGGALTPRDAAAPIFAGLVNQNTAPRAALDLAPLKAFQAQMAVPNPLGGPRLTREEMQARMAAILRAKARPA